MKEIVLESDLGSEGESSDGSEEEPEEVLKGDVTKGDDTKATKSDIELPQFAASGSGDPTVGPKSDVTERQKIYGHIENHPVHMEYISNGFRLHVYCRHGEHKDSVNRCQKRRSHTIANMPELGSREPLFYLGCWLKRASDFSDRDSHVKYNPTKRHVKDYYEEVGDEKAILY